MNTHHKVIIIGSGPGGAIAGLTLAEKGVPVTLLEEGGIGKQIPMFSKEEMSDYYRHAGQTALFGSPKINYVEGCCVGGGSEINSGLYHRTPVSLLEKWGLSDWPEDDFKAIEKQLKIQVLTEDTPPFSFKLEAGGTVLGWDTLTVPKWFSWNTKTKQAERQSMKVAVMPKFKQYGGTLIQNTKVNRIRKKGNHWEIICQNARFTTEHLILSAGAIQTPYLLRKSGIKKNIGHTLTCHPTVKVAALFPDKVNGHQYGMGCHQVKVPGTQVSLGCSVSLPGHLALIMKDHPEFWEHMPNWEHMGVFYAMIPGQSKGTVRKMPLSDSAMGRYQLDEDEKNQLKEGQQQLSHLLKKAGCLKVFPASLESVMTVHLMGSVPLNQATNHYGQLNHHPTIVICDSSVIPSALGVNPQGTVMALSRRHALHYYEAYLS